jgi:hypothetical protein
MSASFQLEKGLLFTFIDDLMDGHVSYKFGAKPLLNKEPGDVKEADCSGFVRYLLYNVSDKRIKIPAGSWHQEEWCKNSKLERVEYSTAALSDGCLRIAFLPKKNGNPRHVWMILNGQTIESHGRTTGPNRRPWDLPKLKDNAHSCFKLAQTYSLSVMPVTTPKASWYCIAP